MALKNVGASVRASLLRMAQERHALFGDDARLIGTYEVCKTADGFNVRADARDPYTVPRCQQQ